MAEVKVEEVDGLYHSVVILEKDEEGKTLRQFEAMGSTRGESLSLLTHVVNASKAPIDEKETIIHQVREMMMVESEGRKEASAQAQEAEADEIEKRLTRETEGSASAPDTFPSRNKSGKRVR